MAETWVINEKIITKDIVTDDSRTISFPVNAIVKNNIGQYKAIDKLEFAYTYDEYGDDDYDCGNAMRGFFHIHRDEGEFEYLVSLTEYMYGSYEPEGPYEYVRWYGYYREDGTQGEYEYTSPDAMKIITFLEPPTGDLLIWLQSNAAKQSSQISIDLTTLSG